MDRKLFGEIIHRARKACGMTLEELAKKTQSSKGYFSGIENGKTNPPTMVFVQRLAKQLKLPEEELLLLAFVAKAPKTVRGFPAFVEFAEKVTAACREKKMIYVQSEGGALPGK